METAQRARCAARREQRRKSSAMAFRMAGETRRARTPQASQTAAELVHRLARLVRHAAAPPPRRALPPGGAAARVHAQ